MLRPGIYDRTAGADRLRQSFFCIRRTDGRGAAGDEELVYESSMELSYAENFSVDYYEGGYKVLTTMDGTKILTVPEDPGDPGRD